MGDGFSSFDGAHEGWSSVLAFKTFTLHFSQSASCLVAHMMSLSPEWIILVESLALGTKVV